MAAQPAGATAPPTSAVATERGLTSVRLDSGLIPTLQSLGVTLTPLAPSTLFFAGAGIASFPIDSGVFDPVNSVAEISHSGGLVLTSSSQRLVVSSFAIEVSSASSGQAPVLTGLATLNGALVGRIALFDVDLTSASITFPYRGLRITNVRLTLNAGAASTLNSIFNTTAFTDAVVIGRARVDAFAVPLPR